MYHTRRTYHEDDVVLLLEHSLMLTPIRHAAAADGARIAALDVLQGGELAIVVESSDGNPIPIPK